MQTFVLVLVVLETTSCLAWTNIGANQHSLRHLPISEPPQWRQHRRSGAASLRASADLDNSVKGSSGGPPPKAEVKAAMVNWAKAVRPEGFSSSRVVVSTGRTLPAVLSQFWTAVADCVEAKYEEERNGDSGFTAQLLFAAPYCELLSDPRIMAQVDKTLDFCAGSCVAFGKTVLLQQYHPQLEGGGDAGGGAAAERRAPFPAFGLRIAPGPVEAEVVSTDKIAQSRMHLELLLNSAASSSSADTIVPAGKRGYCGYPESVPTAESVLTKTKAWAAEVLEGARSQGAAAAAAAPAAAAAAAAPEGLSLMPSTTGVPTRAGQQPLGGWVADLEMVFQYSISGSRTTEEVLSDLWGTVEEVIAKAAETQCRVLNADGTSHTYSPAISALFVAPRFHSFNAEAFKKFGATLAIVLKQSPILDDMTIELYHPEVIQDDGEVDARRRAPYPTIHFKHVGKKAELFPTPRRSRVAFPAPDGDDAGSSGGGSAPSGGGSDGSGI